MGESTEEIKAMMRKLQASVTGTDTPILPKVLRQEDFPQTKFWYVTSWRGIRNAGKAKDPDVNAPVLSMFLEDQFGKLVSEEVKDEVLDALQSYWIDVHNTGEKIRGWSETGLLRKDDFQTTMERKFPLLRLCEGHWKVRQLWTNYTGKWKRSSPSKRSPGDSSDTQNKRQETPIEISSDDSDPPANIKRRREGEEESQPPKRHKGKEREAVPSKFHPTRPQPKKKAKLGTVRISLPSQLPDPC